ncbi:MAG: carbohydrate-binding protein [Candidatus Symbiothrix sp.]|jgi:hypothetical protein|nr:carbohydrate-binding protein [Candidatus Symbiothrix sp.]
MKHTFLLTVIFLLLISFSCSKKTEQPVIQEKDKYEGVPFKDERYHGEAQVIPGKVYCAYYDFGGEGITYHDTDSVNHGSGELNPIDGSYLHGFRVNEGVDISYTKSNDIDNTPYNFVQPPMELLYVGWTEPGEWLKYTVNVTETGVYTVSLLYTSNQGGKISLAVNEEDPVGMFTITSTFNKADPVDFRQWHHWNSIHLTSVPLEKGIQVLKLTTEETGQMNYAYLDFELTH